MYQLTDKYIRLTEGRTNFLPAPYFPPHVPNSSTRRPNSQNLESLEPLHHRCRSTRLPLPSPSNAFAPQSSQSPAWPRAAPLCTGLLVIGPTRLHPPRSRPGTARPKSASPLPAQPNAVCPVAGPTSAPLALCWPPRCRPDLTPPALHRPPDLSPSPTPGPSQPHWPPLASTEVNLSKL
jgi:hypothetical protein